MIQHQKLEEERSSPNAVYFEVDIEKVSAEVGFGLTVRDDGQNKRMIVQSVDARMKISKFQQVQNPFNPSAPTDTLVVSDQCIKVGDIFWGVDDQDCSRWPFSRLRCRLNDFRVPIGTSVKLKLKRTFFIGNEADDGSGGGRDGSGGSDIDDLGLVAMGKVGMRINFGAGRFDVLWIGKQDVPYHLAQVGVTTYGYAAIACIENIGKEFRSD